MKNLIKLISKLKKKTAEPKFYSLVLKCSADFGEWLFLWSGIEYDLEHAMGKAKKDVQEKTQKTGRSLIDVKIDMWTITSIEDIINQSCDTNFKKTQVNEIEKTENKTKTNLKNEIKNIKNNIITEIIENKDKKLFEENKDSFSSAEIKFINNSLKT